MSLADVQALFGVGDQGCLFDFTSAQYLDQSASDDTPVTAYGDLINHVEDLSGNGNHASNSIGGREGVWWPKPSTLATGVNLITNPTFSADTDWVKGTGWTISGGKANKSAGTASVLSQSVSLTAGKGYLLFWTTEWTAGTCTPQITGGTTFDDFLVDEDVAGLTYFVAQTGNNTIEFSANSTFAGAIANVFLYELTDSDFGLCWFRGANHNLRTASINRNGGDDITVGASYISGPQNTVQALADIGDFQAGAVAGSIDFQVSSSVAFTTRAATGIAGRSFPEPSATSDLYRFKPNSALGWINFDGGTIAAQSHLRQRGIENSTLDHPTTGVTLTAGTKVVDGITVIGTANNTGSDMRGGVCRYFEIDRELTAEERATVEDWLNEPFGTYKVAIVGDSTIANMSKSAGNQFYTMNAANLLQNGICHGSMVAADSGDRVADQETVWAGLDGKTALDVVIVQVGLNDINTYIGNGTKTASQIIADIQTFVNTIATDAPQAKIVMSALSPCRQWLEDGASEPELSDLYPGWQSVNDAIMGRGSEPIVNSNIGSRVEDHNSTLDDGSGYLNDQFRFDADEVHPTVHGRWFVAKSWDAGISAALAGGLSRKPGYIDADGLRNRRQTRYATDDSNDVSYRLGRNDAPEAGTYDNKRRNRYS